MHGGRGRRLAALSHVPMQFAFQAVVEKRRAQHAGPSGQAGSARPTAIGRRAMAACALRLIQPPALQHVGVRKRQR
ncbi:hypothetical protein G6F23_015677 [Rhizopus arrhizus]|nr:hypothetical protein G6F23_015677 [Rhizopus arrhizus]